MLVMNIILIGYRGSGKTCIGSRLAQRLDLHFVDTDQVTCRRFGNDSIADIWQQHGEPAWRKMEVEVTVALCAADDQVIALGGGTVIETGGRQAVINATNCKRVYLYCLPEQLHQRIGADANTTVARPDLTNHGGGLEEIKQVLTQRDPVYRQVADIIVDVTNLSIDHAVAELVNVLAD